MDLKLKIFTHAGGMTQFHGERELSGDKITVGRSDQCTLRLDDPQRMLSRAHIQFERTEAGYLLAVLSQHYAVKLNGETQGPGRTVPVKPGDSIVMDKYELEVVGFGAEPDPDATIAVPRRAPPPSSVMETMPPQPRRPSTPQAAAPRAPAPQAPQVASAPPPRPTPSAAPLPPPAAAAAGRGRKIAAAVGIVGALLVLYLAWPELQEFLPDREAEAKAKLEAARLEGEARSLLKLIDADRQEQKEAQEAAKREIVRLEGQVRSARTNEERAGLQAALKEAQDKAGIAGELERKLKERAEGPQGITKAEGNLSAAAAALQAKDHATATKLLGETVASLTALRAAGASDRSSVQAERQKLADQRRQQAEDARRAEEERVAKLSAQKAQEQRMHAGMLSKLLVGRWSTNCSGNSGVTQFSPSGDVLSGQGRQANGQVAFRYAISLHSARHLGKKAGMHRFAYRLDSERLSDNTRTSHNVVVEANEALTMRRLVSSVGASDGVTLIRDGKSVSDNSATVTFHKCGDAPAATGSPRHATPAPGSPRESSASRSR